MIVVMFESWPREGRKQAYIDMAASLTGHLQQMDGFLEIERFQSLTEPGKLIAISYWRDESAVTRWRQHEAHRLVQDKSRESIFKDYRLRVAAVIRDYGMHDRRQAPADRRPS